MSVPGWLFLLVLLSAFSAEASVDAWLIPNPIFMTVLSFIFGLITAGLAGWLLIGRQHARQELQQQALRQLLKDTTALVAVLDQDCQLLIASETLEHLTQNQNICHSMYFDAQTQKAAWQDIQESLQQKTSWQGEIWWLLKQDLLAVSMTITQCTNAAWPTARYLMVAHDVTERKRADQQQLHNLAQDPLTKLPNRMLLEQQLTTNIATCTSRYPTTAILLVKFNHLLGSDQPGSHHSTAERIAEAARILRKAIAPQFTIGRYSTDSFAILVAPHLCPVPVELPLNQLAHQVLLQASQFNHSHKLSQIYVSVGISRFPQDGADAETVLCNAERAAQSAGRSGVNNFCFADSRLQSNATEYLTLQTELSRSLHQEDFMVYFQPQLSISSNRIVGYKALLRWNNPKRGIMQPASFLAMAEQSGMIVALDRLVFQLCCKQINQWLHTNQMRGRVALNISAQHFQQADFITYLSNCLHETQQIAKHFTLELDEQIFQQPITGVNNRLAELNDMGFQLVLNNFGDGISSLTMLRNAPLHGVKIARSLINQMEQKEQQRNITSSLIRLAGYLQLEVTASGVDNEMQAYLLHVMGCDKLQGNLFSKAVPANEIPALLVRENKLVKKVAS